MLGGGSLQAQEPEAEECRCDERSEVRVFPRMALFGFGPQRARLGVYLETSDGQGADQGARISGVMDDSPAEAAGLREGDIITSLDGRSLLEPLPDPDEEEDLDLDGSIPSQRLIALAGDLVPGDTVPLTYLRDGESRTTTVVPEELGLGSFLGVAPRVRLERLRGREDAARRQLERMRRNLERARPRVRGPRAFGLRDGTELGVIGRCPGDAGGWSMLMDGCVAGLRLVPLNDRLGEYFEAEQGVLVADVEPGSELGLEPGDVIRSVGGRTVRTPRDLTRILRSYREGEEIEFGLVRRGSRMTVTGTMD